MGEKIIRNSARCTNCGDEIESKHRHDYVVCECGGIAVDGGKDYRRRAFKLRTYLEDTSIVEEEE